jgi:ATP-dependent Lhr-like helicase
MLNLMLQKWNEPPEQGRLHLSTLLHQVMALIGQRGGTTASQAWNMLVRSGIFNSVDATLFRQLLNRMAEEDVGLLEQATDGTLLPGPAGERLLESRDIFSVFLTAEEYKVIAEGGRAIGQVPGDNPFMPGEMLILAGRRWRIIEVDTQRRELSVRPAKGGKPPLYGGDARLPADGVVQEMRRVWEGLSMPTYLDHTAKQLLTEARTTYDRLGLRNASIALHEGHLLIFPWVGEKKQHALLMALTLAELEPVAIGVAVSVDSAKQQMLVSTLTKLAKAPPPNAVTLAVLVKNKEVEKFDSFLGKDLLTVAWAKDRLDTSFLPSLATELLASLVLRDALQGPGELRH